MFIQRLCIGIVCTCASLANAAGAPEGMWQFTVGGLSYHFPHNKPHNEINLGLGVEYQLSKSVAVEVGGYQNSAYHLSRYALIQYHPFEFQGFRLGATVGFLDGYSKNDPRAFKKIILPSCSRQWQHFGINCYFYPKLRGEEGIVFIELKIPFDEMKSLGR